MTIVCPLECVQDDWLQKHSAFVVSLTGIFSGLVGLTLSFFIKSRCTSIECCCIKCDRNVVEITRTDTSLPNQQG